MTSPASCVRALRRYIAGGVLPAAAVCLVAARSGNATVHATTTATSNSAMAVLPPTTTTTITISSYSSPVNIDDKSAICQPYSDPVKAPATVAPILSSRSSPAPSRRIRFPLSAVQEVIGCAVASQLHAVELRRLRARRTAVMDDLLAARDTAGVYERDPRGGAGLTVAAVRAPKPLTAATRGPSILSGLPVADHAEAAQRSAQAAAGGGASSWRPEARGLWRCSGMTCLRDASVGGESDDGNDPVCAGVVMCPHDDAVAVRDGSAGFPGALDVQTGFSPLSSCGLDATSNGHKAATGGSSVLFDGAPLSPWRRLGSGQGDVDGDHIDRHIGAHYLHWRREDGLSPPRVVAVTPRRATSAACDVAVTLSTPSTSLLVPSAASCKEPAPLPPSAPFDAQPVVSPVTLGGVRTPPQGPLRHGTPISGGYDRAQTDGATEPQRGLPVRLAVDGLGCAIAVPAGSQHTSDPSADCARELACCCSLTSIPAASVAPVQSPRWDAGASVAAILDAGGCVRYSVAPNGSYVRNLCLRCCRHPCRAAGRTAERKKRRGRKNFQQAT